MRIAQIARLSMGLALVVVSVAWSQAQPKAQTATQFYMAYRAAFDKATKIDDLFPYMAAKNVKQAEATPKADRDKMFGLMKMMGTLTDVKVLKEEHAADGNTVLTVEGLGPSFSDSAKKEKTTGKITITKEGGAWKILEEGWKS